MFQKWLTAWTLSEQLPIYTELGNTFSISTKATKIHFVHSKLLSYIETQILVIASLCLIKPFSYSTELFLSQQNNVSSDIINYSDKMAIVDF